MSKTLSPVSYNKKSGKSKAYTNIRSARTIFWKLSVISNKVEYFGRNNVQFKFCMRCDIISLQNCIRNNVKDFAKTIPEVAT